MQSIKKWLAGTEPTSGYDDNRKQPNCSFKFIAVAKNVDATSEEGDYKNLWLWCHFLANDIGHRLIQFTTKEEGTHGAVQGSFPPHYPIDRQYVLSNESRFLLKNTNQILVRNLQPALNSSKPNQYDIKVRFTSVELARSFLRQVKGFIGGRLSDSAICGAKLDELQLLRRRLANIDDDHAGWQYYNRVTWRQLPPVGSAPTLRDENCDALQWPQLPDRSLLVTSLEAFSAVEKRANFCEEHGRTSDFHDYADSIAIYSKLNDGDILAMCRHQVDSYLATESVAHCFETPFNYPHILSQGSVTSFCIELDDLPGLRLPPGRMELCQMSRMRSRGLRDMEGNTAMSVKHVPRLMEDVKLVWSFILETKLQENGDSKRRLVPCGIYMPKDGKLIDQNQVSLFLTQAIYPDDRMDRKEWRVDDVIIALTEKPPSGERRMRQIFQRPSYYSIVERWARMIPTAFGVDRYQPVEPATVHWILIVDARD